MRWINAEQQVTVTIYDEEHEEHLDKIMTVEEMLDTYTNEGCPTIFSNPERKKGKWINTPEGTYCDNCNQYPYDDGEYRLINWRSDYCPNCGADIREKEDKL